MHKYYLGNGFWAEYHEEYNRCMIRKNNYYSGACLKHIEKQGGLGVIECEVPVSKLIFDKAMAFAVDWGYDHNAPYKR